MDNEIKIMVVTHKQVDIPIYNPYIPMLVGPDKENINEYSIFLRDDTSDNISDKNENYCELTALYWAYKNEIDATYIGLVHYRRFFMSSEQPSTILQLDEMKNILKNVDVILPKKRNYFIEDTWNHYKHNHNIDDLIETRKIIEEKFPEYMTSFNMVMNKKKSHRFNMMIMEKKIFTDYCEWLFDILFELENRINIDNYDDYQKRVYGFISERLLDVWVEKNKVNYAEVPFKFTERQNWVRKGTKFLINKIKN